MKILIAIILTTLAVVGCTTLLEKNPESYGAIIQLHEVSSGRFFCSATVVSRNYAITAAHCTAEGTFIRVFDSQGRDTQTLAEPIKASGQLDYALLQGDFSKFRHITPELNANKVVESFKTGSVNACGYPMGGSLTCYKVDKPEQYIFFFKGASTLYPGMSGGPVIDEKTQKLIGVNSAVTENGVLLTPIINLLFGLDL